MGNMQVYEFEVGHCQQIDANLTTCGDNRGIISGMVTNKCGKPVCNAVVQLYEINKQCKDHIKPITHTFTDEFGAFLFGPLCPGLCYGIKVWSMNTKHSTSHYTFNDGGKKQCMKAPHKQECGCERGCKCEQCPQEHGGCQERC